MKRSTPVEVMRTVGLAVPSIGSYLMKRSKVYLQGSLTATLAVPSIGSYLMKPAQELGL